MTEKDRLKLLTIEENLSASVSELQAEKYVLQIWTRSERTTKKEFDQFAELLENIGYHVHKLKEADTFMVWGETL